nr:hypothetical protein OG781_16925 [Streptomyces sp. NBC_00830]
MSAPGEVESAPGANSSPTPGDEDQTEPTGAAPPPGETAASGPSAPHQVAVGAEHAEADGRADGTSHAGADRRAGPAADDTAHAA